MTSEVDAAAGLTAAVAESLAPVRAHLATVEATIAEKEKELAELRAVRTLALRIIRAGDPNSEEAKRPRPGGSKGGGTTGKRIARETVDAIAAELRRRFTPDDDIYAAGLAKNEDFTRALGRGRSFGADAQLINSALHLLHEEGALRLDHVGGTGKASNAKAYRLTTGGGDNGRP